VDWDDLRFFLLVARHGTLTAAARELKVSQPTVGRRIDALERRLGAKLFARSSEGFELSSSGARVLEHAEQMERDVLAVEHRVSGRDAGVRGAVRVTAAEWLVTGVLSSLVGPLVARHPHLTIELVADARHVNLARREADLALRPRRFEHDGIVQRATEQIGFGLYAARSYFSNYGAPTWGDGDGHVLVTMMDDVGDVARGWLRELLPGARPAVKTNGRDAMLSLALSGVGLVCLARVVGDGIQTLKRLTPPIPPPSPTLWLGTHRDARSTPRVRAVASHLVERIHELRPQLCPED
jgi:DNA-binding transcriptional LysR family regulator